MNVENIIPMASIPKPPRSRDSAHVTVLRREVVESIGAGAGDVIIDATIGAGGHAEALLEAADVKLIGVDRDASALELSRARLARFGSRVTLVHGRFSELERHLDALGIVTVQGLVADFGVSSMQLDDGARGMSFRSEGPLDMRMDTSEGETALDLIDRMGDDDLADVIYKYGEERRSRRVARCIKQARAAGDLSTTLDLRRAVVRAVGPARIGGVDPATKTFQALRIAVNGELDEIEHFFDAAPRIVAEGGIVATIAFHSLEDRLAKRALRDRRAWQPLSKKPIVPGDAELDDNPRARSAKLRVARRVTGGLAVAPGFADEETEG